MSNFNIYITGKGTHTKVCFYWFSLWAVFQLVPFNVCLGKEISISIECLVKLVETSTLTLTFWMRLSYLCFLLMVCQPQESSGISSAVLKVPGATHSYISLL